MKKMKYLIIIAGGETSKHREWKEDHTEHGFDLCLLNYSGKELDDLNSKKAKFVLNKIGLKFKLISQFFLENPQVLDQYDYVMIMDDDIDTTVHEIRKFFDFCNDYGFDLAQPALGMGSYFTYPATTKIYGAMYHTTTTVEIMMPCFSRAALKKVIDDIHNCFLGFGFGLEGVWVTKLHLHDGLSIFGGKIGVIDCVDFYHRKPIGGSVSKIYEKFGNPELELREFEKKYGFNWSGGDLKTFSVVLQ